MDSMIECPECGEECENSRSFNSHWGHNHDGPTPDDVDTAVNDGEDNPMHGVSFSMSEEHKQKIADALSDRGRPKEVCEQMSRSAEARWAKEEERRKQAERLEGRTLPPEHVEASAEGNRGTTRPESFKEHMSEVMKGNTNGGKDVHTVPETGHVVDSKWEAEIDRLLHLLGVEYGHEPRTFEFEDGRGYTPDFIVGNTAIEVKGWPVGKWSIERARRFMESHPEYTYVVIGSDEARQIPSDTFIEWDDYMTVGEVV